MAYLVEGCPNPYKRVKFWKGKERMGEHPEFSTQIMGNGMTEVVVSEPLISRISQPCPIPLPFPRGPHFPIKMEDEED